MVTRREVLRAIVGAGLIAAIPSVATATPGGGTDPYEDDPKTLARHLKGYAQRVAWRTIAGPSAGVLPDGLEWFTTYAAVAGNDAGAVALANAWPEAIRKTMIDYLPARQDIAPITAAALAGSGHDQEASSFIITDVDGDAPTTVGIIVTQRGRWVQVLYGPAIGGNPIAALADYAKTTSGRWPGDPTDPSVALPVLDDVPTGAYIAIEGTQAEPFGS